jgi:hypothetical protein
MARTNFSNVRFPVPLPDSERGVQLPGPLEIQHLDMSTVDMTSSLA